MRIRNDTLKSVFFIGYFDHTDEIIKPVGSAVYLYDDENPQGYVVTAGHVIQELVTRGVEEIYVSVNIREDFLKEQVQSLKGAHKTTIKDWTISNNPETGDIAFYAINFKSDVVDYLAVKFSDCLNDNYKKEFEVSLGDEVFITGLFYHHSGKYKNIPIVRIGNIAAFNEEKVMTRMGPMDAYLIESRSIGGLSGSSVYVNLGSTRYIQGKRKHTPWEDGTFSILMGIMHGHYDEQIENPNTQNDYEKINMGIAIVTPIQNVINFIRNK